MDLLPGVGLGEASAHSPYVAPLGALRTLSDARERPATPVEPDAGE